MLVLIPVAISLDLSVPAFAAQFGLRTTPRIGVSFYANGYDILPRISGFIASS
jgi:hypothetical protein